MTTRTIFLITTDVGTRRLISVRETVEDALKSLNIASKIAVKNGSFPVVVVDAPSNQTERVLQFRLLGSFLANPARLVLLGDWNVIQDPKLDKEWELAGG